MSEDGQAALIGCLAAIFLIVLNITVIIWIVRTIFGGS